MESRYSHSPCMYTQLPSEVPYRGNMLLDLMAGAKVLLVQPRADISRDDHVKVIHGRMEQYAEKLRWEDHCGMLWEAGWG